MENLKKIIPRVHHLEMYLVAKRAVSPVEKREVLLPVSYLILFAEV
jgi:hypothetical protein